MHANGLTIRLNGREPSGAGATGSLVVTFQPEGSLEETVSNLKEQGVEVPAEISEHPWRRVAAFIERVQGKVAEITFLALGE